MLQLIFIFFFFLLLIASAYLQGGDLYLPSALLLAFVGLLWLRQKRNSERGRFVRQLRSYRHELLKGGSVVVDGLLLRRDTLVTTYEMSIGLILISLNISSPYRTAGEGETAEALTYSIFSLLGGWWAFPSGPLLTTTCVGNNMRGGRKESVESLLIRQSSLLSQPPLTPKLQKQ